MPVTVVAGCKFQFAGVRFQVSGDGMGFPAFNNWTQIISIGKPHPQPFGSVSLHRN
jgi:hypothetical protein